ncbi:MAG: glycosyltransferase family 1 protein [Planctomycetota bacterium]
MRIAFDCSHQLFAGGVRVYLENLLYYLTAAAPDEEYILHYRVPHALPQPPRVAEGVTPKTVHCRRSRRLLSALENRLGWPKIEKWTGDIDIFHSPHFWLPVTRGARQVLSVHDVAYLKHPEYYGNPELNDYGYKYLLRHSLDRADAVIVPCQHTKDDLVDLCGADPGQIWIVPFGSDCRFAPASEDDQRRAREHYQIDRPYVLFPVGTFEIRKNIPRTLQAFAKAFPYRNERPLLFMTGVGAVPREVRDTIVSLRLEKDVCIDKVGYPGELCALMTGARWGMYPSLYEGFGLPPLEAMGCGLPMLVGNTSSQPEVAGDAAILVNPHDVNDMAAAMRRLHDDGTLREEYGERGRRRARSEGWSWSRAARQTLAVYRNDRQAHQREENPLELQLGPELVPGMLEDISEPALEQIEE